MAQINQPDGRKKHDSVSFTTRQSILWFDSLAGGSVGALVLIFGETISRFYLWPRWFIYMHGLTSLAYSCYAAFVASRTVRKVALIKVLAMMNVLWASICLLSAFWLFERLSILGTGHLFLETLFVGGLGLIEWKWRHRLSRPRSNAPTDRENAAI